MVAQFPNSSRHHGYWQSRSLLSLPRDLRRMLSVQLKELIHHIEDAQNENSLQCDGRVKYFLERCYRDAA